MDITAAPGGTLLCPNAWDVSWVPLASVDSVDPKASKHLMLRLNQRTLTPAQAQRFWDWVADMPLVPWCGWHKQFLPYFLAVGRQARVRSILDQGTKEKMVPYADDIVIDYVREQDKQAQPRGKSYAQIQKEQAANGKQASAPSVGYHVTPSYNLPKIMAEGLVPQIGDRSREIEEAEPGIYLFKSPQDVEDALVNWLGEEFDGEEPIALLKVRIPADAVVVPTPAKYEFVIGSVIPPENIQIVTEDTEAPDQGFWSHLASELSSEDTTKTAAPKSVLQPGQKLTDLPAFKKWFQGSKVVDAQGNPLRVFRGDYRADRVSDKFKVNRSTSGRFYFTDDPEIASKYSEGKPDAQHSDENAMYETWFTFPDLRQPRERKAPNLKDAWWRLTPEQKARVREVCLTTTRTDQGEMTFDADSGITSAASMDWTSKEHHGNWLAVLEEYWLSGGTLFGEEKEFIKILDHCGLSAIYDAPDDPRSVVTPVYLNIQNPLDTDRIPPDFITRVHELAKKDRTKAQPYGYGAWDKSTITLAGWVDELDTDAKDNTTYAWTTIPEKVTKLLQSMGFDGICDRGGKNGGTTHTVWIAFEPYQIKSAMGNKGTFDYMKDSIIASAAPVVASLRQTAAIKGGTYYHGGPDIPGDVLRPGSAGAIFFTQSREYAVQYMKGHPGVLYEIQLDFADRKIFDPENAGDIEQLREGFLALVNGEEYSDEESALNDYSYAIQHTLLDWAEGSQWFEPVEAAGFHGMRLRERPGMIGVNQDGSFSVSGDPIESVAMFDKEIKVERAVPQPYAETSLKQAAEATPFERWFAGSKVVEDDGSPKIVYHGTYKKWDTAHTEEEDKAELDENFRASGVRIKDYQLAYDTASRTAGAVWFTDSEGTAEGFVSYNGDETDESGVMAAYLRILNPLDLRPEVVGIVQVKKVLSEVFGREEDFEAAGRVEQDRRIAQAIVWDNSLLISWAKVHGHDGLIYPDTDVRGRGTHTSYVTFKPNQIKSATDNTGMYDPESMSITAASAEELDWRPILTELMQVLKPGLPVPEIKFVKQKTNWLGTDYWAYRRSAEGVESADKNTVISIQKSVMGDEQTFRKVLAHELAHHEDSLVNKVAEFERLGFYTMKAMQRFTTDGGHGPKWQAIAARFNAKYGEGFVSRTSDQTYVVDSSVTKPFFVLMQRYVGGKIMWQYASRLSPKMRDLLVRRKREGDSSEYPYKLFLTTEPLFLKAPTISPFGGYSIPRTDEQIAACEKMWAEGEDVLAQYAVVPQAKEAAAPDSPGFQAWFAGSQVVDTEGNPLRCYHGTKSSVDFDEFSVDGPPTDDEDWDDAPTSSGSGADPTAFMGAHFAQEPRVANQFANGSGWMKSRYDGEDERPRVIPVYLSVKNPKVFVYEQGLREFLYRGSLTNDELIRAAMEADGLDPDAFDDDRVEQWGEKYDKNPAFRAEQNEWIFESYRPGEGGESDRDEGARDLAFQAVERLRKEGHDGVRYKNEVEGGISWIVFSPNQVKSAFAQTFNKEDARFTASLKTAAISPATGTFYHGTASEFDDLRPNRYGIIWVGDNRTARSYADMDYRWRRDSDDNVRFQKRIIPVQLASGAKLIDLRDGEDPLVQQFIREFKLYGAADTSHHLLEQRGLGIPGGKLPPVAWLREHGVDGVFVTDNTSPRKGGRDHDSLAVINPKVIKPLTTQEPDTDGDHKVAARQRYADPPSPPDPQTETPAFKSWFSGSKVVDGGGRPLVVYHGAPDARFLKDVDTGVFKSPKERYLGEEDPDRAFFFAADHATAASYADDSRAFDYQAADPGVFAAYLCLRNPLVIDRHGERWKGTDDTITRAKADGHDGVIIRNTIDTYNVTGNRKTDVYAAFHPEQIKAAKGNRGDFNPGHKSVLAAIPSNLRTPVKPKSKEYDAVRRVYQYYVDHNIKTMPWARFQKEFQQVAAQYRDLFTELRHNRPAVTMDDLDAYLDEAVNAKPGYDVSYDRYHDKATSHRDVEQLVLQINQSASAANIIAEDSVLEQFVDMVRQASTQSGHPSGEKTVGWLRVDFIDADYILIDEVQSDLVNAVSQAKAMVEHRTFDEFMANIQSQKIRDAIEERGISREQFTRVRNNFIQSGFTAEKLDDIKRKLVDLFKDWAEYAISTVIEVARAHNIKHVCLHTAETVARRDDSVEADKVKIYYDQLARSFGFKKEEITDGDLKGKFWVRTASATVTDKITFSENKITAEESSYEGTTLPGARIEAHADDRSVGAIEIVFENDNAYVRGIGLAPEYRGRGIGQILYDRAIAFAKKEGCHDFYSDKANAMSKDADKAWNRLRGRYRVGFKPGEDGYDSTGRKKIDLKTASPDFGYSQFTNKEKELKRLQLRPTELGKNLLEVLALKPGQTQHTPVGELPGYICAESLQYAEDGSVSAYTISRSDIVPYWRGTGLGQMLYDRLIVEAKKRGAKYLYSDENRSTDAFRAWKRLAQRHTVELDPELNRERVVLSSGARDMASPQNEWQPVRP